MHGIVRVFGRMADTTRRAHIVNKPIYPWPPSSIQFISLHRESLPKASEANESVIVVLLHHYDWACVRFSFRFLFTRVVAVVPFHFISIRFVFLSTAAVEAFFFIEMEIFIEGSEWKTTEMMMAMILSGDWKCAADEFAISKEKSESSPWCSLRVEFIVEF